MRLPRTLSSLCHPITPSSSLRQTIVPSSRPSISYPSRTHFRPFISSFFPGSSSKPSPRTLSASKILPYPSTPCFRAVADVSSYSQFLPFITRSVVYETDDKGYPTSATLTAGYGPTEGSYRSNVNCDEGKLVVTARSGRGIDWGNAQEQQQKEQQEGLFEFLDTVWKFAPVDGFGQEMTKVDLTIEFQLRSAFIATLMNAVEGEVAKMMIDAFAKRMETLHGQK